MTHAMSHLSSLFFAISKIVTIFQSYESNLSYMTTIRLLPVPNPCLYCEMAIPNVHTFYGILGGLNDIKTNPIYINTIKIIDFIKPCFQCNSLPMGNCSSSVTPFLNYPVVFICVGIPEELVVVVVHDSVAGVVYAVSTVVPTQGLRMSVNCVLAGHTK